MSEFQPLPLPFELEIAISSNRLLAEEMFDLLERKGEDEIEIVEGFAFHTKVTDRVDTMTTQNGELALRLRQRPSVEKNDSGKVTGPSERYYVACIETGSYSPLVTIPDDDDITWKNYVTIVVDSANLDQIRVLDSGGVELNEEQVKAALRTVYFIRDEMRNGQFEAGVAVLMGTMVEHTKRLDAFNQTDFISEEFLDISFCGDCGVNVPCSHNPETLN